MMLEDLTTQPDGEFLPHILLGVDGNEVHFAVWVLMEPINDGFPYGIQFHRYLVSAIACEFAKVNRVKRNL
jgi:hypothetical protein